MTPQNILNRPNGETRLDRQVEDSGDFLNRIRGLRARMPRVCLTDADLRVARDDGRL
jgi:hypothetical protein